MVKNKYNEYEACYDLLEKSAFDSLREWSKNLPSQVRDVFEEKNNGNLVKWNAVLSQLPQVSLSFVDLDTDWIQIGKAENCDSEIRRVIQEQLIQLDPWRKGPYSICGIEIDTEWKSDWKWNRLKDHITPLKGRMILDVGCGNGYHCWRMLGAGAKGIIGIDPYLVYVMQYRAIRHFMSNEVQGAYVLPIAMEQMPKASRAFDTVFSMGVLYHRRSPLDHLIELKEACREGGELVLETLVIDGGEGEVLVPKGRYAKMRNVWFIPSCLTLEAWLKRIGFKDVRLVDVNQTTTEEQRSTEWMKFESLTNFLDPNDCNKTIEGYPAPKRALFVANEK